MKKFRKKQLSVSEAIALTFFALILAGAALLALPFSSRDGHSCGLLTALFTATSSVCVTGLSVVDTWTQWSAAGQVVILCLIEIGGLGFMSAASILFFIFNRDIDIYRLSVIAQSIGSENLSDVLTIQKRLLKGAAAIQLTGAAILCAKLAPRYGFGKALWLGIFHAISAFCNAGFDVMGFEAAGTSLAVLQGDAVIVLTLIALIAVGGLGFLVWDELYRVRSPRRWSVYTRLVLIVSTVLLVGGTLAYLLLEYANPATFGTLSFPQKLLAAAFQSMTTRTAGFAGVAQGDLTQGSQVLTMLLMFIGGSSGSTAGGVKTVTFFILLLFLYTRIRGRKEVEIFNRSLADNQIMDALTIVILITLLGFGGGFFLCVTSQLDFLACLFESYSALATVGLSLGITSQLSVCSKLLIILYMYIGRVGILTLCISLRDKNKIQYSYPKVSLLIG